MKEKDKDKDINSKWEEQRANLFDEINSCIRVITGKSRRRSSNFKLNTKFYSNSVYVDLLEDMRDAKKRYEKIILENLSNSLKKINKKIDLQLKKEIIELTYKPGKNTKNLHNEIDSIFTKYSEKRIEATSKELLKLVSGLEEEQSTIHSRSLVEFKSLNKNDLDDFWSKYSSRVKRNFSICKEVYPEMSKTWNLIEDKFPHLTQEEINRLTRKFYNTINSNLKNNNNLAFIKINDSDDIELQIIELNYRLNKGEDEK